MPDMTPVANQVIPPDPTKGINTFSGILGLKQRQLEIQTAQARLPGVQAESQQQAQTAGQRSALAQYMQNTDLSQHVGKDGTLDLNILSDPGLRQAAGDSFPQVAQQLLTVKNSQLEAKSRLAGLNDTLRSQFDRTVGSLREDDDVKADNNVGRAKVKDAMGQFAASGGPDAQRITDIYDPMLEHVPKGKLSSSLGHLQLQAQSATEQQGQQNPAQMAVSRGSETDVFNVSKAQGLQPGQPPAQRLGMGLPPQLVTTPAGPIVQVGGMGGGGQAPSGAPAGPIPSGLNLTKAQVQGQVGTAEGVTGRVQQAQAAANNTVQAQDALSRAKAILEAPGAPNTGASFEKLRGLKNVFSSAGIDTEGATDANSLVKNLARYEAARATQAGLGGTDAARELAHNGSPHVAIDNRALLGIVNQSLATEKAIAAYASKQSKTTDPNQMMKNENDFRNIPNIIQGHEYLMARSPKEADEILGRHGLSHGEILKTLKAMKQFEGQ